MNSVRPAARALVLVLLLLLLALVPACGAEVPSVIKREMAQTPKGRATVVFFTDFQCPFCRRTHAALEPVLEQRRDRVRLVLRHVPLPRHPDARTAARAAVCVERLAPPERARAFAEALFRADDLAPTACEELAVAHGAEREAYRSCVADRSTDARIDDDIAMFAAVSGDGVPLLFIGGTRLEGMQPRSVLEEVVAEATR